MTAIAGLARLALWLVASFVLLIFLAPPAPVPPGNVWTVEHVFVCVFLMFGAYRTARPGLARVCYFLYGCLGGYVVMQVLLPDSRDYIGIAMGHDRIEPYLIRFCVSVVVLGVLCLMAAQFRLLRLANSEDRAPDSCCKVCGYLLRGLPEPRCPECGTPFDPATLPKDEDEDLVADDRR